MAPVSTVTNNDTNHPPTTTHPTTTITTITTITITMTPTTTTRDEQWVRPCPQLAATHQLTRHTRQVAQATSCRWTCHRRTVHPKKWTLVSERTGITAPVLPPHQGQHRPGTKRGFSRPTPHRQLTRGKQRRHPCQAQQQPQDSNYRHPTSPTTTPTW